jgi:hypothetical protein
MRLILTRVLWNFDMELQDESIGWEKQPIFNFWEKGSMHVKILSRKVEA